MTTESGARELLARAAATIEVDGAVPSALSDLPDPGPRRRLPVMLAAAAAVVVAVGVGVLIGAQVGDGEREPDPLRTPVVTDTPTEAPTRPSGPALDQGREDELRRTAETLRAWAAGQWIMAPEFAEEVRLLLQDDPWGTLSRQAAQDPGRWAMCSGVAPADCSLDPLKVLADAGATQYSRTPGSVCAALDGVVPADLERARADDLARLSPARADCSTVWHVEVWINSAGEVYAVNLVVSPQSPLLR